MLYNIYSIEKIKDQYTNKTYQVIISKGDLLNNNYFTIIDKKENDYTICLKEGISQKEAIQQIISDAEVVSFNKKIPTMEEIFIKAVNNE